MRALRTCGTIGIGTFIFVILSFPRVSFGQTLSMPKVDETPTSPLSNAAINTLEEENRELLGALLPLSDEAGGWVHPELKSLQAGLLGPIKDVLFRSDPMMDDRLIREGNVEVFSTAERLDTPEKVYPAIRDLLPKLRAALAARNPFFPNETTPLSAEAQLGRKKAESLVSKFEEKIRAFERQYANLLKILEKMKRDREHPSNEFAKSQKTALKPAVLIAKAAAPVRKPAIVQKKTPGRNLAVLSMKPKNAKLVPAESIATSMDKASSSPVTHLPRLQAVLGFSQDSNPPADSFAPPQAPAKGWSYDSPGVNPEARGSVTLEVGESSEGA